METLEAIKRRPIQDIIDERDLHSTMAMGIVISGRQIDLLRLKTLVEEAKDLKRVHHQITYEHLAIVKRRDWEDFVEWKKTKR